MCAQEGESCTSFAGYTPFSVHQPFSPALLDKVYGPEALTRAKAWSASGRALWCGTGIQGPGCAHFSPFHPIPAPFRFTSPHFTSLLFTSLHFTSLHFVSFRSSLFVSRLV
eukprot:scaffold87721_cov48-Prasinocladus_malaysianus.AAC.2